jgi:hypothetical protein
LYHHQPTTPTIDNGRTENQKSKAKISRRKRAVKARPFGFFLKISTLRVVFLKKALTALPACLDKKLSFFGFLLEMFFTTKSQQG